MQADQQDIENKLISFLNQFVDLKAEEIAELLQFDLFKYYPKGTQLLDAGASSAAGYLVMQGCVRSYYLKDGNEITTAFYTENQSILPSHAILEQPSSNYLICVEDCTLLVSNPNMEQQFFEKFPHFYKLCSQMADQLLAQQ